MATTEKLTSSRCSPAAAAAATPAPHYSYGYICGHQCLASLEKFFNRGQSPRLVLKDRISSIKTKIFAAAATQRWKRKFNENAFLGRRSFHVDVGVGVGAAIESKSK